MTRNLKMLLVGHPSLERGRKHLMKAAFPAILGLLLFAGPASAVVIVSGTGTGAFDTTGLSANFTYGLQGSGNVLVFGTYIDTAYTASNILFDGVAPTGTIQDGRSLLAYYYNPDSSVNVSFNVSVGNVNGGYYLYELSNVDTGVPANLGTSTSITTTTDNRFVVDFVGNNFTDGTGLAPAGGSILTSNTITNFNGALGGGALGSGTGTAGAAGVQTLGWVPGAGGTLTGEVAAAFVAAAGGPVSWNVNGGGNWGTGANWTGGNTPSSGGEALFADVLTAANAPATITLNVPVNIGKITFSNANRYNITGPQTLTLSGAAELAVGNGTHGVSANIAGSAGLTKSGGGNLVLTGANTYSGTTSITGGSLHLSQTGAVPGAVTVAAAGELRFVGDGLGGGYNAAFSNSLSGDGNLTLDPSLTTETVTRSTASSLGGQTLIDGGTLAISNATALGTGDGTPATQTRVNSFGGVGTGKLAISGNITISDELLIFGPRRGDTATLAHVASAGNNTWTGNIKGDANGDNYNFESTSGTLTLGGTISAPDGGAGIRNFVFSGAGNFHVDNKIVDTDTNDNGEQTVASLDTEVNVHVFKQGSGTLTISTATNTGADYWKGDTVIEGGTLEVISDGANNGELRSRSIDIRSGATLDVDHFGTYALQVGQSLSGAGTVLATGKTLAIFDDNLVSPGDSVGTLTITGNATLSNLGGGGGALNYELGNNPAIIGGTENDLILINGSLSTVGAPSMAVNVTASEGEIVAGQYRLISHTGGAVTVSGLTPQFSDEFGNPLTVRQNLTISSTLGQVNLDVTGSAANLTWTGANGAAWDKNTTQNWTDGGPQVFFDQDQVTFDDSAGANTTVDISGTDVYPALATFDSATGNTYTITGANGFGGSTPINLTGDVTVVLQNTNTLQGNINIGANATLNIGAGGGASTVSGNIGGPGSLVIGGGFNPFSSANSLTGPITINAGTVTMSNAGALGTTDSGTTINTTGVLDFNFVALSVSEPLTFNGGAVRVNGNDGVAVNLTGPVNVNAAGANFLVQADVGADGLVIPGNISGSASGPLNVTVAANSTMSVTGNITNNGNLVKNGAGVFAVGATTSIAAAEMAANGGTVDLSAKGTHTLGSGQTLSGKGGTVLGNIAAASGSTVRVGDAVMPAGPNATYYEATWGAGGNTTLSGGGQLNPPAGVFSGNDEWSVRTFGNGAQLLQGAPIGPYPDTASVPVIQTTISGLVAGASYEVYPNFWDNNSTTAVWPMYAGQTQVGLTLFQSPTDTVNLAGATDAITLNAFNYTNPTTVLLTDGDRTMFGAPLGTMMADPNGMISVFVDDTGNGPNERTLYDGITLTDGSTTPFGQAFTLDGDLTLAAGSTLQIDIAAPGVSDLLDVTGNFGVANGFVLQVSLDSSVDPSSFVEGDSWDLLDFATASGTFSQSNFILPTGLSSGLVWDSSQLLVDGTLSVAMGTSQPGDFDMDGDVDGRDFLLWQRNPGIGNLADWETNYGFGGGPIVAGSTASSAAVPEPGAAVLLLVGVFASASVASALSDLKVRVDHVSRGHRRVALVG